MNTLPLPEVIEPKDAAEARRDLDAWLVEWHKRNPGQVHPLDLDAAEWAETLPAPI